MAGDYLNQYTGSVHQIIMPNGENHFYPSSTLINITQKMWNEVVTKYIKIFFLL